MNRPKKLVYCTQCKYQYQPLSEGDSVQCQRGHNFSYDAKECKHWRKPTLLKVKGELVVKKWNLYQKEEIMNRPERPKKKEVEKNSKGCLTRLYDIHDLVKEYNQCCIDHDKWIRRLLKEVEEEQWEITRKLNPPSEEYIKQYKKAQLTSEIITAIAKRLQ